MRRAIITLCLVLAGVSGLAAPAHALRTTYTFLSGGLYDCEDEEFNAEFPEMCPGGVAGVLSVEFRHDQPIWDNDASGCDPSYSDEGCDASYFSDIVNVGLSGIAVFSDAEIRDFIHADFLGTCPVEDCESPVPFIYLSLVDHETDLKIDTSDDGYSFIAYYELADGRSFEDFGEWERGPTVPESGTLTLLGLGLAGLGLIRRRPRRQ